MCPGSVLRTVPASDSPWTTGFPASQPVYFSNSRAYVANPGAEDPKEGDDVVGEALLTYPKSGILLSGWARNAQKIAGASAWRRLCIGDGQVHLFGFRPHYRSWSQTTFKALFRAMLLPAEPTAVALATDSSPDTTDD